MKILTLNIWGAPYAKHRSARIDAIATEISRLDPDIVCFQEVYLPDNRRDLIAKLRDIWCHYHYFPSALIGSGLLTVSKYPIVDAIFHQFRMQGKPEDVKRGDYYAGKGVGLTRIDTPDGTLDVYNSHTHAQYELDNDNEYAVYNETNLYEVARFIDSQSGASPVVLCGDLNTRPDQLGYRIITQLGSLVDADLMLNETHPVTFSSTNPYSQSVDQCLDYVLVRNLGVQAVELVMTDTLSGEALAYSDHYGLVAEIDLYGDKFNDYDSEIAPVMTMLTHRVRDELIDTEALQIKYGERAVIGLASIFDGWLMSAFLTRFDKQWANRIRWMGVLFAVLLGLWNIVQAGLNVQNRKNTLAGIQHEIEKQIESKRLFDGREL